MSTLLADPPKPRPRVPAASPRMLTAADLALLPTSLATGDVRYELDDGRLVVMPPPGDQHSYQQSRVVSVLNVEGEWKGHGQARGEVGIILRRSPDRVVAADAAFILTKSLPARRSREGYLETIPELVVEIRSKNDSTAEVNSKIDEYFDAGVVVVWVIDPERRTIAIHSRGNDVVTLTDRDTLTAEGLIPDFAVPVSFVLPAP